MFLDTNPQIASLHQSCQVGSDVFVHNLPKIELHTHIEGTLSPSLRWQLAKRNGIPLLDPSTKSEHASIDDVRQSYLPTASDATENMLKFFRMFDEGLQVLQHDADFYDLAFEYFQRCARENVRYVEVFFGPHSHFHRGIAPETFMKGYRRAQLDAMKQFGVKSAWIMILNRQKPQEEAWENYRRVALAYRDMVIGIGLAGNEVEKPPMLFSDLMTEARAQGFKITAHCDIDVPDTHEHIRQVAETLAGTGADRIDHGLNIADDDALMRLVNEKGLGLTLCPWGYTIYNTGRELWVDFRKLMEAGLKVTINSDDPPYMLEHYTEGNLMLAKIAGGLTNAQVLQLQNNAVQICWAPEETKTILMSEIEAYSKCRL